MSDESLRSVLIAGGVQDFGPGTVPIPLGPGVVSAELYDPVSGTFTPTGTFDAAIDKLDHLVDLGVGAIERYEVPGLRAIKLVIQNALGGGAAASLRDSCGSAPSIRPHRRRQRPQTKM